MEPAALPALTGPRPEVVAYAEADRPAMLDRLAEEITAKSTDAPADLTADMVSLFREVALRQTDAMWWLNNVTRSLAPTVAKLFTDSDKARHAELRAARG